MSLLDNLLTEGVKLWATRPTPAGRPVRVDFGEALYGFIKELGNDAFELMLPTTKATCDRLMKLFLERKSVIDKVNM